MHLLAIVQAHHNNILSKHIFLLFTYLCTPQRSSIFCRIFYMSSNKWFVYRYMLVFLIAVADYCVFVSIAYGIIFQCVVVFCVCIGQDWMIEMRVPNISSNKTTHFMFMSSCVFLCFTKTFVPFFYIFG